MARVHETASGYHCSALGQQLGRRGDALGNVHQVLVVTHGHPTHGLIGLRLGQTTLVHEDPLGPVNELAFFKQRTGFLQFLGEALILLKTLNGGIQDGPHTIGTDTDTGGPGDGCPIIILGKHDDWAGCG